MDVHKIDLGQDSNRPRSFRVDGSCELETVRVGQIGVGRSDGEDDGVGLGDELEEHVSDLLLNVSRLVADWDLSREEGAECQGTQGVSGYSLAYEKDKRM
jgi:hypothetical protein